MKESFSGSVTTAPKSMRAPSDPMPGVFKVAVHGSDAPLWGWNRGVQIREIAGAAFGTKFSTCKVAVMPVPSL